MSEENSPESMSTDGDESSIPSFDNIDMTAFETEVNLRRIIDDLMIQKNVKELKRFASVLHGHLDLIYESIDLQPFGSDIIESSTHFNTTSDQNIR